MTRIYPNGEAGIQLQFLALVSLASFSVFSGPASVFICPPYFYFLLIPFRSP